MELSEGIEKGENKHGWTPFVENQSAIKQLKQSHDEKTYSIVLDLKFDICQNTSHNASD